MLFLYKIQCHRVAQTKSRVKSVIYFDKVLSRLSGRLRKFFVCCTFPLIARRAFSVITPQRQRTYDLVSDRKDWPHPMAYLKRPSVSGKRALFFLPRFLCCRQHGCWAQSPTYSRAFRLHQKKRHPKPAAQNTLLQQKPFCIQACIPKKWN